MGHEEFPDKPKSIESEAFDYTFSNFIYDIAYCD